ncbi:MAG: DUF1275 domain-containing protein [Lachnospiraceae bacterium]|nr:DUF1275 domain-containing protein [Lachnospiraceae bacterium]
MAQKNDEDTKYLECEKQYVFYSLIFVGGVFGGYTFVMRGGVFCNAQTANLVMLAIHLGQGDFSGASYYFFPFLAYLGGTMISEALAFRIKTIHLMRWDTFLVGLEAAVTLILGFIPSSAPDQICQLSLNFLAAMQFNTFRQAEGVGMATTFVTNHVRQFGSHLVQFLHHHKDVNLNRFARHGFMILSFVAGAAACSGLTLLIKDYAIWAATAVEIFIFIRLLHADRTYEKELLYRKPHGH